jgi:ankyrin repeat protein
MDNPLAVSQLCANGFDVNTKDKTGKTPVQLAVAAGFSEVVRELVACGAKAGTAALPLSGACSTR